MCAAASIASASSLRTWPPRAVKHPPPARRVLTRPVDPQLRQVLRDRGPGRADRRDQPGARRARRRQQPQQPQPGGVGEHPERLRGGVDLRRRRVAACQSGRSCTVVACVHEHICCRTWHRHPRARATAWHTAAGRVWQALRHRSVAAQPRRRRQGRPALESSRRAARAVDLARWSWAPPPLLQAVVVAMSGSVALLGDTLHNVADALTAVPLGVAFLLGRRAATRRYTYGYGRAEDLAGIVVVVPSPRRRRSPATRPCAGCCSPPTSRTCGAVAAAGAARVRRQRDGRRGTGSGSAGGSARRRWSPTGCTPAPTGSPRWRCCSAPAASALGWRWADPLVGLAITVAILLVLWSAAGRSPPADGRGRPGAGRPGRPKRCAESTGVVGRGRGAAALDRPRAARRGRPCGAAGRSPSRRRTPPRTPPSTGSPTPFPGSPPPPCTPIQPARGN